MNRPVTLTPASTKVRKAMQVLATTDANMVDDRKSLMKAIDSLEKITSRIHSPSKSAVKKRRRISVESPFVSSSPHKKLSVIAPESHLVRLLMEDVIRLRTNDRVVVACDSDCECEFRDKINPHLDDGSIIRSGSRRRREILECDAIVINAANLPHELNDESIRFYNDPSPANEPCLTVMLLPECTVQVCIRLRDVIDLEIEVWRDFPSYFNKRAFRRILSKWSYNSCAQAIIRFSQEISGCLIQSHELHGAALQARAAIDAYKAQNNNQEIQEPTHRHVTPALAPVDVNNGYTPEDPGVPFSSPLVPRTLSTCVVERTIHEQNEALGVLDKYFERALERLFGGWLKGCQRLFNPGDEDSMLADFEKLLPSIAAQRFSTVLSRKQQQPGYKDKHPKEIRKKKLKALYSYLADSRVRNNRALPHFAAAHALCSAAKGRKDIDNDISVSRGYAMRYCNAFLLCEKMVRKGNLEMQSQLQQQTLITASIDNFQEFTQKKNQRNGKSVTAKHGTSEYFVWSKQAAPPIGSVFVRKEELHLAKPVKFAVEQIVHEGPYESRLLLRNRETTKTILYPNTNWVCTLVSGSSTLPELTYIDQEIPPSLLFRALPLFEVTSSDQDSDDDSCDGDYAFTDGDQMIADAYSVDVHDGITNDAADLDNVLVDDIALGGDLFQGQDYTPPPTNVPFTVKDYGENVETASVMAQLYRFVGSVKNDAIHNRLKQCRSSVLQSKTYQKRMMKQCNPFIEELSEVFVLPMSKFDEISRVGCTCVIFELLKTIGLIKQEEDGSYTPARDDFHDVRLHLTVDYLTAKNVRAIKNNFRKKITQPGSELFVLRALDCVKPIRVLQAQLHTNMHQVDTIQRFFYGGLIQVAQAVLGWKRIQMKSLERFQLTVKLHDLMYEELTRCYVEEWSADLAKRGSVVDRTKSNHISNVLLTDLLAGEVDDQTVLRILADDYKRFVHPFHMAKTNDEYVNFLGQFHLLTGKRRAYYTAMREGDFHVAELQHVFWLPLFAAAKKHNYVESCLDCTDSLLEMDPMEREEVRRNMCLRMNKNRRMITLDEKVENINLGSQVFQDSNTIDSVSRKSQLVLAGVACARSLEPSSNKLKSSTVPAALPERRALSGLFGSLEVTKPTGRKLTKDGCWRLYELHKLLNPPPSEPTEEVDTGFLRIRALFSKLSTQPLVADPQNDQVSDDDDDEGEDEVEIESEEETTTTPQNMKRYATQIWVGQESIRDRGLRILGNVKEKRTKEREDDAKEWALIEKMARHFQQSRQDCAWESLCDRPHDEQLAEWETAYQAYLDNE